MTAPTADTTQVDELERPVLLFSAGKDSVVLFAWRRRPSGADTIIEARGLFARR